MKFNPAFVAEEETYSVRIAPIVTNQKGGNNQMTYSVHPKDGYSVPPKGAYILGENFDSAELAQAEIDRLGLTDVLEVRGGGVEDGVIPITRGIK